MRRSNTVIYYVFSLFCGTGSNNPSFLPSPIRVVVIERERTVNSVLNGPSVPFLSQLLSSALGSIGGNQLEVCVNRIVWWSSAHSPNTSHVNAYQNVLSYYSDPCTGIELASPPLTTISTPPSTLIYFSLPTYCARVEIPDWNVAIWRRGHVRAVELGDGGVHGLTKRSSCAPCPYPASFTVEPYCFRPGQSGSDRRERTVPSVLNGQSVLFYHYRSGITEMLQNKISPI